MRPFLVVKHFTKIAVRTYGFTKWNVDVYRCHFLEPEEFLNGPYITETS